MHVHGDALENVSLYRSGHETKSISPFAIEGSLLCRVQCATPWLVQCLLKGSHIIVPPCVSDLCEEVSLKARSSIKSLHASFLKV